MLDAMPRHETLRGALGLLLARIERRIRLARERGATYAEIAEGSVFGVARASIAHDRNAARTK